MVFCVSVITTGIVSVEGYFPNAKWYDFYSQQLAIEGGGKLTMDTPINHVPVCEMSITVFKNNKGYVCFNWNWKNSHH